VKSIQFGRQSQSEKRLKININITFFFSINNGQQFQRNESMRNAIYLVPGDGRRRVNKSFEHHSALHK
jgi:hypothetical protein